MLSFLKHHDFIEGLRLENALLRLAESKMYWWLPESFKQAHIPYEVRLAANTSVTTSLLAPV